VEWFAADGFLSVVMDRDACWLKAAPAATEVGGFAAACAARRADPRWFATAKVDAANKEALDWVQQEGFRVVDMNLCFEGHPEVPGGWDGMVRPAIPEDEPWVRSLAAGSLTLSRFHQDPRIPDELAGRIKAGWVGNYFAGLRGQAMLVAEKDGQGVGFLLLLVTAESLVVDLVAVDASLRRQGVARAMLGAAMGGVGAGLGLRAGTQAANAASIRLYENLGLRLCAAHYVLHAHGGSNAHR